MAPGVASVKQGPAKKAYRWVREARDRVAGTAGASVGIRWPEAASLARNVGPGLFVSRKNVKRFGIGAPMLLSSSSSFCRGLFVPAVDLLLGVTSITAFQCLPPGQANASAARAFPRDLSRFPTGGLALIDAREEELRHNQKER